MRTVVFTRGAIADLDDIFEFHIGRNPRFAGDLVTRLRKTALSLAELPERGLVQETARGVAYRRLIESDHAILYAPEDARILIVRFVYGSRDIEALLADGF